MPTKNYASIAQAKIYKPSTVERKPRYLIYSRNKKGKTTLCDSADNVLILDPERGSDHLRKSDPDIWPIEGWTDLDEVYQFLKGSREARGKYQWIAVDGTTRMSNMALRYVMNMEEERSLERRPGFVAPRDYGQAGELFKGMLLNFQSLPMGIIYTAQERMIEAGDMGTDGDDDAESSSVMFVPDLPKGARASLNSIVDGIGRLYVVRAIRRVRVDGKIEEKGEYNQRRLWLTDHVQYDTGFRSEHDLPNYLRNPTIPKLTKLLQTGNVKGDIDAR